MNPIEQLCIEKGLRMTDQRRTIAKVLSDSEDHPDAEELYRRASQVDRSISLATVYRTVKLFEESGIIERHDFRDGRSRYEQVPSEHHDHLIDIKT
ncbi:MAG: Fur family transcriptional regulator, partial [Pseudomonadota bacterium]